MEIRIYSPPTALEPSFVPLAVTYAASAVRYTENFFTFGDFEITIPNEGHQADAFDKYLIVRIDEFEQDNRKTKNRPFWGVVLSLDRSISAAGDMLTVSGVDLKGLANSRYTLPPLFVDSGRGGVAGFDAVTGTTEACMKHFVNSNFFSSASPTRSVPGLVIAPDQGRGTPDDRYMSRYDLLSDVLADLGRAANLGYTIVPSLAAGTLTFDCVEGVDRSGDQSERSRVFFTVERRNVADMRYTDSDRNTRNVFYATLSGAAFEDEAFTATYTRDDTPDLPSGIGRWEQHLDISASHPTPGQEYDELKRLAMIRAESYRTVEALSANVLETQDEYGKDFFLGDIVTVQNRAWGVSLNARVTAMTLSASAGNVTRTVTFGDAPVNPIARLRRQIRGG